MGKAFNVLVQIVVVIIVVAIIAALISKRSQSVSTIQGASSAFNSLLQQILSPITATASPVTNGLSTLGGLSPLTLPSTGSSALNSFGFQMP